MKFFFEISFILLFFSFLIYVRDRNGEFSNVTRHFFYISPPLILSAGSFGTFLFVCIAWCRWPWKANVYFCTSERYFTSLLSQIIISRYVSLHMYFFCCRVSELLLFSLFIQWFLDLETFYLEESELLFEIADAIPEREGDPADN